MKSRTISRTLKNPDAFAPLLAIHGAREYDTAVNQLNKLVERLATTRGTRVTASSKR